MFPSQSSAQQSLVRVINYSDEEGEVHVHAIDDSGESHGPVTLPIGAKAAIHFNSRDLEQGSEGKGMSGGTGDGEGAWRLRFDTDLDVAVFAYVRQSAFVGLHDVVQEVWPGQWYVPTFNPGSNLGRLSLLRLINPNDTEVEVLVDGLDALGDPPPDGPVRLTLPSGAVCTLSAIEVESGEVGSGPCQGAIGGRFGDGEGKWQLLITADLPIQFMNLMRGPNGEVSNLSTLGAYRGASEAKLTASGSICVRCPLPRLDLLFAGDGD